MSENESQLPGRNDDGAAVTSAASDRAKTGLAKIKEKFLPGVRITLLISLIFYIAMFVIGIIGVHNCPVNENIPLFLIATGGIGLFSKSVSFIREKLMPHFTIQFVESSLYTAETVFLIFGSYWVFKVYKPSFYEGSSRYCQKTVYMFAFIYLAVLYALLLAILLGFFCFLGCIFFVKRTESDNRDPEAQAHMQGGPQENKEHGATTEQN
ncbi:transmembrane protein 272-like [Cylas formicarius]|uniref:transmembrane protein 272-like n=1 Tax=Cylas formicarius TaxID=197179 RepID=UPI00295838CC|nr:transmembrane protein 272-like [Cylas formicarius]